MSEKIHLTLYTTFIYIFLSFFFLLICWYIHTNILVGFFSYLRIHQKNHYKTWGAIGPHEIEVGVMGRSRFCRLVGKRSVSFLDSRRAEFLVIWFRCDIGFVSFVLFFLVQPFFYWGVCACVLETVTTSMDHHTLSSLRCSLSGLVIGVERSNDLACCRSGLDWLSLFRSLIESWLDHWGSLRFIQTRAILQWGTRWPEEREIRVASADRVRK